MKYFIKVIAALIFLVPLIQGCNQTEENNQEFTIEQTEYSKEAPGKWQAVSENHDLYIEILKDKTKNRKSGIRDFPDEWSLAVFSYNNSALCTCAYMQLQRIPCSHVLAVCSNNNACVESYVVASMYFCSEYYRHAYAMEFRPILDQCSWPPWESPIMIPSYVQKQPRKPKTKRIRNTMDKFSGTRHRCGGCRQYDHSIRTYTLGWT